MRSKIFWTTLILTIMSYASLFAQGTPCGDSGDPDVASECPLDTWVLVLVAAFLIIATMRLYKKGQPGVVTSDR